MRNSSRASKAKSPKIFPSDCSWQNYKAALHAGALRSRAGLWLASFSQYDFDGRKLFSGFSVHERTFIRTTGTSARPKKRSPPFARNWTCRLGQTRLCSRRSVIPRPLYCLYRPIFEGKRPGGFMRRSLILASVLASFASLNCLAQSSQSGSDSGAASPRRNPSHPLCCATAGFRCGWATAAKIRAAGKTRPRKKRKQKSLDRGGDFAVGGSIFVVGDQHPSNNSSRAPALPSASDGRDAAYYRGRLAPLRQQIDDVEPRNPRNESVKGTVRENLEAQVQIREARREKTQKQINEIEEDARRHGLHRRSALGSEGFGVTLYESFFPLPHLSGFLVTSN